MATTPIFTKTFDFVTWLLSVTNHFPRSQRFVITRRLLDAALDFQEYLVDANIHRGKARDLRFAKVWGSGKFDGQQVGVDYLIDDGDILELHM